LKSLGFTLNFAPVVDLDDQIWKCRSFPGDERQVSELAEAYISGLQREGILATAKHYPGKTLVVKDPHKHLVVAIIHEEDIYPYQYLVEKDAIDLVMVSHLITTGAVNSEGIPSVASLPVMENLKNNFDGLVISDEIQMMGVKGFYETLDEMYVAVFKAGNDIILNFDEDPMEIYRMILTIKEAVENGEISEERIDDSVKKILTAKGFVAN
jgi:beta-glucosidase-like glycosyl hydrolase